MMEPVQQDTISFQEGAVCDERSWLSLVWRSPDHEFPENTAKSVVSLILFNFSISKDFLLPFLRI